MQLRSIATLVVVFGAAVYAVGVRAEVNGNAAAGKAKAATCAACHGIDGNGGADPSWPKLAGQLPEYLVDQLKEFKSGARKNPLMSGMAAPLSEQDMKDLAVYFASLPAKPGAAASKELALAGERLYRGGNAQTGVAACMSCHGPAGRGIPPTFPRVTGQNAAYTEKQLLDFKARRRVDHEDIMIRLASRLTEAEIKAVSQYMAGLR